MPSGEQQMIDPVSAPFLPGSTDTKHECGRYEIQKIKMSTTLFSDPRGAEEHDEADLPLDPASDDVGLLPVTKVGSGSTDTPEWQISEPPVLEETIFQGDSKATTWEARKGVYQVMHCTNMSLDVVNTGYATFYKLNDDENVINATDYMHSFGVSNTGTGTWAVQVYKGISKKSGVTFKSVQFAEGVVNPTGPYANLTPRLIDPDPQVILVVEEEQRRLCHAYPSNYNDLSQILGSVFKVAKEIGGVAKGIAGGLTGVPLIGDVARVINDTLHNIGF